MKRVVLLVLALLLIGSLAACRKKVTFSTETGLQVTDTSAANSELNAENCYTEKAAAAEEPTDYVQFELENGACFVVQLFPDAAPETVTFFKDLVGAHAYDGQTFHRVDRTCIYGAQTPAGENGTIRGEYSANGYEGRGLSHTRGTVSMYHGIGADSGNGQFFIMIVDDTVPDGKFAAFGRVVAGMETVDAIAALPVTEQGVSGEKTKPVKPPVIAAVTFVQPPAADDADR